MISPRVILTCLLAYFSLPGQAQSAGGCPEGYKYKGQVQEERDDAIVVRARCEQLSAPERERTAQLDERLARTRRALQELPGRAAQLERDLDEWVTMHEGARTDAQLAIRDMGVALGMEFLRNRVDLRRVRGEQENLRLISVFPSFGGTPLQQWRALAIRQIHSARTDADILRLLEALGTGSDITATLDGVYVEPEVRKSWAIATMTVLESLIKDPFLKLVVADAKLVEPVIYGYAVAWKAHQRISDLGQLGERQYQEAKTLGKLYMDDIAARNRLLDETLPVR